MPKNIKLALDVCHLYNKTGYILLIHFIFQFFENSYKSLDLFFIPLCMMMVSSFIIILEFSDPLEFIFIVKIFLFL